MQNLNRITWLTIIWLVLALALPAEDASLETFLERLKPLSQSRTIQAEYTQTRHISDLDFDLTVKGRLAQEQDQRLAWMTETPLKSICIFTSESFRMWDAESGKTNVLNAAKYPWIRMIFELQSAWMSGNAEVLKRAFALRVLDECTLELSPFSETAALFFTRISVTMAPDFLSVERAVFTEPSGDTITIVFTQMQRDAPIPETTWQLP
jgi:hypothetical protein